MRRPVAVLLIAPVAVLALANPRVADAARSITGAQIADGSLTSADVRDRSLTANDFKGGRLPAADSKAGQNSKGGDSQLGELARWDFSTPGSAEPGEVLVRSTSSMPEHVQVIGLELDVTAATPNDCGYQAGVEIRPDAADLAPIIGAASTRTDTGGPQLSFAYVNDDAPIPLVASFYCLDEQGNPRPVPAMSGSFVFRYIDLLGDEQPTAWK